METKKCKKCNEEKPNTSEFFYLDRRVKNKLRSNCKKCESEASKRYRKKNKEKILANQRERRQKIKDTPEYKEAKKISDAKYYKKNKNKLRKRHSEYYKKNKDQLIKKSVQYQRKWRKTDRGSEWTKKYSRDKIKNDENYRLIKNLRCRLWHSLTGKTKSASTIELLGCSIEDLKIHLESLFQPGMTWENYGNPNGDYKSGWHIDHIRPCISFDLSDPIEQRECFNYKNLQPLWAEENLSKGAIWNG